MAERRPLVSIAGSIQELPVGDSVGGVVPLGADSKIAATYLPSYVDDVVEVANYAALPGTGETGKIYTTLDNNKIYRWSGSAYVEISPSPGSTDSVTEGSSNLYHTAARVRDAVLTGLSTATNAVIAATDSVLVAFGKLQAQVSAALPKAGGTMSGAIVADNNNITGLKTATFNGLIPNTTTTGSVTIDWTAGAKQTQSEPTGTITYTFTATAGACTLHLIILSDGTSTAQTINFPAAVKWIGATWAGAANKGAVITFFYDGTTYWAMGSNQV